MIIDHGSIFFDGLLSDVIDRFADFKLVTIECAGSDCPPRDRFESMGEVVEHSAAGVQLKVKRDRVIEVCKQLFDRVPIKDIDIEEVPIEDIIGKLFDRRSKKHS